MGFIDLLVVLVVFVPMALLYEAFSEPMCLMALVAVGLVIFIIRAKMKEREQVRMRSYFPDDFKF